MTPDTTDRFALTLAGRLLTDARPPACTKDCTVDCGRCKGDPLGALQRRMMRWLRFRQDGHGGIPWDDKPTWRKGYDEARRAVQEVFDGLG